MRFTVLGKSPAWGDAGGACSGYLLEADGHLTLIDCGNGVFAKLRERADYLAVDDVVISHLHADHFLDLVPYAYALTLPPRETRPRPRLWLPPGGRELVRTVVGAWGGSELIESAFDTREYERAGSIALGAVVAALHPVPHFTLTHAVELLAPSGGRLVYGADCRKCTELSDAAGGAELLLAEATLAAPEDASVPLAERGHMSASEAGEVAAAAGVGRLVLTHISDELDLEAARAAAARAFDGEVEVAAEGSSWEI